MMEHLSEQKEFVFAEDEVQVSYLHPYPITSGTSVVESKNNNVTCIFQLPIDEYKRLLFSAKNTAHLLCNKLCVKRSALLVEPVKVAGHPQIKIIPLHGVSSEWTPILNKEPEYFDEYPGFCNSKNGPRMSEVDLNNIQNKIRYNLEDSSISYAFYGDQNDTNLFSRIVRGEEKQWRIWEDSHHVAFLTPFPNTPGFTVIVPRKHLTSDIFSLDDTDYEKLIEAAYKVSTLIKTSLSVESTCMIFEGFEIDYAHIKLIPVFNKNENKNFKEPKTEFHSKYLGYVTSLNGDLYPKDKMLKVFKQLTKVSARSGKSGKTEKSQEIQISAKKLGDYQGNYVKFRKIREKSGKMALRLTYIT
nr:uncharacterized protein LOC124806449 isoform X2 [Hydra vulgaris]XP_047123344.1 uncharacterized protein LOC124806449 isoform X2 [Hydra vulgaris]XP_047123345.1 uncharacterized protein LOC124806449 isoform X2 [Hydra vulgaris]XP_047123346.1 uncharacterized protein LOC124806449 isoform X2 [Hydra vulgaris]